MTSNHTPLLAPAAWLRADLVERVLLRLTAVSRVLEVGPGLGAFGARLARRYAYVGIEQSRASAVAAARAVRSNGGHVVCGDERCLGEGSEFDLIVAFEVLEHIHDDVSTLRAWSSHLSDGGLVLVSVPAFRKRFNRWDQLAGHFRRYDPEDLAVSAASAGLRVVAIWTYGFPLGLLLEGVRNRLAARIKTPTEMERRTELSGRWYQPSGYWGRMLELGAMPWRIIQRPFHSFRMGHGLVMLASRDAVAPQTLQCEQLPRSIALRAGPRSGI